MSPFPFSKDAIGSVVMSVPPVGDEPKGKTKTIAPGITEEIRFAADSGDAAVLISTKIRAGLPKDDAVLERIEPKYKNFGDD
jgi:hypothetical protein